MASPGCIREIEAFAAECIGRLHEKRATEAQTIACLEQAIARSGVDDEVEDKP